VELQANKENLSTQGLGLAAISYDSPAVLAHFSKRKGIEFPLLSDPDSRTIRAFGILNEAVPKDNFAFGIPNPVTYIVDANGVIVSRHFEEDYRERPTLASILSEQYDYRTGAAESETETKHLKVNASASDAVVRGGEHISLRLDVALNPKMHVYAPGVEGYIPIDWKMSPNPAASALPVKFPQAKKLYLKAIDETVVVYEGNFSLQREVAIAPAAKLQPLLDPAGNFTIEGVFRYQACDDHMCYLPQNVPVKWKLHFEAHDRERVPVELQKKSPAR
jgi:hypothetical protein